MTASLRAKVDDALATARQRLLAERGDRPYWLGELADSPLATAVAISALALAGRVDLAESGDRTSIGRGLAWLTSTRGQDGGWGDTPTSPANPSATLLAVGAMRIADAPVPPEAEAYLQRHGGVGQVLAAYGDDRTFSVPILTHSAVAGMTAWADVPILPFELAVLPHRLYAALRLPVVSYALPALIAIGLARHVRKPTRCPFTRPVRTLLAPAALRRLRAIQPTDGGFLSATPLTAFVTLGLLTADRRTSPVVRAGLRFLRGAQRPGGAWAIDENLSVWNTTMAVEALGEAEPAVTRWLLDRQRRTRHPYTGAAPGGWGWTHLDGAVPDADDTAGALVALRHAAPSADVSMAAIAGARWLLDMQNDDGGWPTFCRGWGRLPFDRSACDLTAHTLIALRLWREALPEPLGRRCRSAERRGLRFLAKNQRPDGAWLPLWFGSQHTADHANPVFGTARVLRAYRVLNLADTAPARRGRGFLAAAAGERGWGADAGAEPTVEETAVAIEALAGAGLSCEEPKVAAALDWLCWQVGNGGLDRPSPIGLYFARLWYHEKLYPVSMATRALRLAAARLAQAET